MAVPTSFDSPGKARPGQLAFLNKWLAALLSVRYVQQSLILTWKNCKHCLWHPLVACSTCQGLLLLLHQALLL